jgi:putative membrane protein
MTKRLLLTIVINAVSLFLVQKLLGESSFYINSFIGFILVGSVMGILNFVVKPILSLLSLPFVLLTFGLFLAVINSFLLFFNEYLFREILTIGINFSINGGFFTYVFASFLLSFINGVLHFFIRVK